GRGLKRHRVGARLLAGSRKPLAETEEHQQNWSEDPDLVVRGQAADEEGRSAHQDQADISCAPTSSRKTRPSCGAIICCLSRSKEHSRTSKATSRSGRSFTRSRRASRPTSS